MALWVDSAPSENEYQEHFLRVKAAGAWGWQPQHLHVPNVMKSGSLSLLEPSGPHRACYGTSLSLPFTLLLLVHLSPRCISSKTENVFGKSLLKKKTCLVLPLAEVFWGKWEVTRNRQMVIKWITLTICKTRQTSLKCNRLCISVLQIWRMKLHNLRKLKALNATC